MGVREKEIASMRKDYIKSAGFGKSIFSDRDDDTAETATSRTKLELGYALQFIVPGLGVLAVLWLLIKFFSK